MQHNKKEKKKHILMTLFLATLYLSAFTFGGGYVIVSLLKNKFVDHYHWIDEEEMLDLVAIAQSSPGAIAVNGSIVVGYKLLVYRAYLYLFSVQLSHQWSSYPLYLYFTIYFLLTR